MVDKVIVSNERALRSKYGAANLKLLKAAITNLIKADAARGLKTQCVWIDNPAVMKKLHGVPPINPADERGNKAAVDAIAVSLSPDYILLLDGPDVIPHITLDNPVPSDGDTDVPSDLPYASPAPFSRQIAKYLKVTRVISRVPNVPGASSATKIIGFLNQAAAAHPINASSYLDYYGLSAKVWDHSTQMSLNAVFGNHTNLDLSPPTSPPANDLQLSKLSHFINCHGGPLSPEFAGQSGSAYPTSLTSAQVSGHAAKGAVVAAECCYGAQLYDPVLAAIDDPICISYLVRGALGFLGSTTIAYGPAASNAQADLMAQYFFEGVLAGASLGRAVLQAQQKFITTQKMTNPVNLKTLGQFLLLADPSVCPCLPSAANADNQHSVASGRPEDAQAERKMRRFSLTGIGNSISGGKAVPVPGGNLDEAVKARVRAIAADRGYKPQEEAIFSVKGNVDYRRATMELASKGAVLSEHVMMITERKPAPDNVVDIHHLVAHIVGEGIASIEESVSR